MGLKDRKYRYCAEWQQLAADTTNSRYNVPPDRYGPEGASQLPSKQKFDKPYRQTVTELGRLFTRLGLTHVLAVFSTVVLDFLF
jgi:hypothetical protein